MDFTTKLQRLVVESNLSEYKLAERLGTPEADSTVRRWIKGARNAKGLPFVPDLRQALALARLFGVPLDWLADDSLELPPFGEELDRLRDLWRTIRRLGVAESYARIILATGDSGRPDPEVRRLDPGTDLLVVPPRAGEGHGDA